MIRYVEGTVDLAVWAPPQRLRLSSDGEQVVEKLPTLANMKMLGPSGHVVFVALANGMGRPIPNDPYRNLKLAEKRGLGFLPYGKCPKADGSNDYVADKHKDSAPCKLGADGHALGIDHPCKCIVEIQRLRREKNGKKMDEIEARHLSAEDRAQGQRERQIEVQARASEKMVEIIEKLSAKDKK